MRLLLAALAVVGLSTGAWAHRLNVFAYVEDGQVVVESRFSNGNAPRIGDVQVLEGNSVLIMTLTLGEDGTVRFPLDPAHVATGLLMEVTTTAGHDNYWILTPDDIARGAGD